MRKVQSSRRNGKYRRQIRVGGKVLQATFTRKEDADHWYSSMRIKKERIEKGIDIGFQAMRFEEWAGRWMSDRRGLLEESTFRTYNTFLKNDLLPVFGERYLHMITARDIQLALLKIKEEKELSNSTYNRMRTLLNTIFVDACKVRPQHLTDNPMIQVKKLTETPPIIQIFERPEDMNTYLNGAWELINPPFWMAVMVFLNTGARVGEVLALKRSDVNLSDRFIQITKAMDYKTCVIKPYPKGKRHRLVPLNDSLMTALIFWLEFDSTGAPEDFLIRWSMAPEKGRWKNDGRHFSPSHTHKLHDDLCRELGFEGLTLHSLRHSYATHQLNIDNDLYRLKGILGHQDIKTTERYLRLLKERLHKPVNFEVGADMVKKLREPKLVKA